MDPAEVRHRATGGILALLLRQLATLAVNFTASVALARLLLPADFGIYTVASFVVWIVDSNLALGLGKWLIQSKEEPGNRELSTILVCQAALGGMLFLALWIAAPHIVRWYGDLEPATTALIRVMGLSILLGTLKTIPASLMERRLEFKQLALVEIVGNVAFQIVAVTLALSGQGAWSFVIAVLVSSVLSVSLMWRHTGLVVVSGFDSRILRSALKFGGPWQASEVVRLLKDNIVPTLIAKEFGLAAVGYLTLASTNAFRALRILPILDRVAFATYARLRDDQRRLRAAIEYSMFVSAVLVAPPVVLLAALADQIIPLLYGAKWEPSIPALRWFAIPALVATVNWTGMSALFALGRTWSALRINAVWAILLWLFVLSLTASWGFTGYAVADAGAAILVVWTIRELRKVVPVRVFGSVARPIGASLGVGLVAWTVAQNVTFTLVSLIPSIAVLLFVALRLIGLLDRERMSFCLNEIEAQIPAARLGWAVRLLRVGLGIQEKSWRAP